MTDTSGFQARVLPATTGFDAVSGPLLTETYWGFTLRKTRQLPSWIVITQVISFLLGAAFIAAALGFRPCTMDAGLRVSPASKRMQSAARPQ